MQNNTSSVRVSIAGGSGYAGGELIRLLLDHPGADLHQVTSERFAGKKVSRVHPNLRKLTTLPFCSLADLDQCDLLFLSLPHGHAMRKIEYFKSLAPKIIDLSGDFRLHDAQVYSAWYGRDHCRPDHLSQFVYGIPEINRHAIRNASLVTGAGCNATAALLGLLPVFKRGLANRGCD